MIKYKLGFKPSPPDERDFKFSVTKPKPLPKFIDLSKSFPPCFDQGQLSSCTGNAISAAILYDEVRQKKITPSQAPIPSRLFIYWNERILESPNISDSGACIRDGMKVISENGNGFCSEAMWPYDESKVNNEPIPQAYKEAAQHKIKVYKSIPQDSLHLRTVLAGGFPFVFGFQVFSNINDTNTTGILTMPSASDSLEGGHAVCCVGYNDDTKMYKVRNSWGCEWGNNGYFEMPYDYMHNKDLSQDFWSVNLI